MVNTAEIYSPDGKKVLTVSASEATNLSREEAIALVDKCGHPVVEEQEETRYGTNRCLDGKDK